MKVVVTGSAGFIGHHLCNELLKHNYKVVGIDCFTDYYNPELKKYNTSNLVTKGLDFFNLDLVEDDLSEVMDKTDFIFHLAAQPGINDNTSFETYVRNNVVATKKLLDYSLRLKQLKCFVNIGTSSIYGKYATLPENSEVKPTSYYGVTKLTAEQLVLAYNREKGFPACSLRLFSVFGPGERPEKLYPKLIHSILTDTPFPLFEGSEHHLRSFTYVGDIIRAFMSILMSYEKCIGEIFNIGSEERISTGAAIKIIEELLNKEARFDVKPKRIGDQLCTHADISKAKSLLNYCPKTKIREGFIKEIEWYKNEILGKIDLY